MITIEQVERLRERANVSYDEAKAALEACGGDLLDSMIYLERQGKVKSEGGAYSSRQEQASAIVELPPESREKGSRFGDLLRRFGSFLMGLLRRGNENFLDIYRRGELRTSMPVTVLAVLLLFAFWFTLPLMAVGLFFGFRYRFSGPDLGRPVVNESMDYVAEAAEDLKNTIRGGK